ncbi:hypothetical protein [Streptomyces sp. NPDC093261]|uniref:hypothetical protein n=1 Tax=Streptomyces sp. NPDC093261 TaxID=3366037 RepID=UPI0037F92CDD
MAPRDDAQPSESNSDVWTDQFGVHVAVPGSRRRPGVPEARTYDPGREVEHPGSEVYFPPVRNGLDYLVSVVEHLEAGTERVSARDLKYAVLHLAAGAEVLLKARLQLEHWSLVFSDPAKARRSELEDGSPSGAWSKVCRPVAEDVSRPTPSSAGPCAPTTWPLSPSRTARLTIPHRSPSTSDSRYCDNSSTVTTSRSRTAWPPCLSFSTHSP